MNKIQLHNVSYYLNDNPVLSSVSDSIPSGQVYGLIGASGSGKTTLIKVINGLAVGVRGEVLVDGKSIYAFSPAQMLAYHRRCGLVFQNSALINNMTILENLSLGFKYNTEMSAPEIMALLQPYLDALELKGHILGMRPGSLSTGEKMLVNIIRAVSQNPEIIFWDEPLASLDTIYKRKIKKMITDFQKEKKTMILVTSDLDFLFSVSDKIAVLDRGVLVESGSVKHILASKHQITRDLVNHGDT